MMQPSTPTGAEGGDWEIIDGDSGDDWDEWEHVRNTTSTTSTSSLRAPAATNHSPAKSNPAPPVRRCHTPESGRRLFIRAVRPQPEGSYEVHGVAQLRAPAWLKEARRQQKHYEPPAPPLGAPKEKRVVRSQAKGLYEVHGVLQVRVPAWLKGARRHQKHYEPPPPPLGAPEEKLKLTQVPEWIGDSRRHYQYSQSNSDNSDSSDDDDGEGYRHYKFDSSQLHRRARPDWGTVYGEKADSDTDDSDTQMDDAQKSYREILLKQRARRKGKVAKKATKNMPDRSRNAKRSPESSSSANYGYDTGEYDFSKSKGAIRHAAAGDVSRKAYHSHGHTMRHRGRFQNDLIPQELTTDWRAPNNGSAKKQNKLAVPVTAFESAEQEQGDFFHLGIKARAPASNATGTHLHQDPMDHLQRHASAISTRVEKDFEVTDYSLKTTGYVTHNTKAHGKKKAVKENTKFVFGGVTYNHPERNTLYCLKPHSKHPLAVGTISTDAPASMANYERLPGSLRSRTHRHNHYQQAFCTQNHASAHWSAASEDNEREYLEYDLGVDRVVTGVSTKAKHPVTHSWPTLEMLHAEGFDKGIRDYKGPRFNVVNDDESGEWVERYELLGRSDGGKKWHSISLMRGNTDMHTEVAHSLAAFAAKGREGLTLRYLRFRPLSSKEGGFHGWKSMRISIFGPKPDTDSSSSEGEGHTSRVPTKKQRKSKRVADGADDDMEEAAKEMGLPNTVTYTVYKAREGANRRYGTRNKDGFKNRRSIDMQRKQEKEVRRHKMKQGVKDWGK